MHLSSDSLAHTEVPVYGKPGNPLLRRIFSPFHAFNHSNHTNASALALGCIMWLACTRQPPKNLYLHVVPLCSLIRSIRARAYGMVWNAWRQHDSVYVVVRAFEIICYDGFKRGWTACGFCIWQLDVGLNANICRQTTLATHLHPQSQKNNRHCKISKLPGLQSRAF